MSEPCILFPVPISELKTLIFDTVTECLAAAAGNKSDDSPEGFISREVAADLLHISCQTLAKPPPLNGRLIQHVLKIRQHLLNTCWPKPPRQPPPKVAFQHPLK